MMDNDIFLSELLMLQCYVFTGAILNSRQTLNACKCLLDFFCFETNPIIDRNQEISATDFIRVCLNLFKKQVIVN